MASLCNINPDGAYDGQQRRLEDFQFGLENMLAMSQLVGKSAEERNAASVMLEKLAGTKNKTAAEVAAEVVTVAPNVSGQKVLYAVLAANNAGRARMIVREDNTKNGAWAWARLRERFGRDEFHRGVSIQLAERKAVRRRVARLGQESLEASTRVTELTSDRATDDQRVVTTWPARACEPPEVESSDGMGRHSDSGRKISLHNLSSTATTTNGQQCCVDRCKMPELWKPNTSKKGTKMRLARLVANKDTWQVCRSGNTQTPRQGSPKGTGKGSGKEAKAKERIEHLKHVYAVERQDTQKQIANSRLQHVQTAEKLVT